MHTITEVAPNSIAGEMGAAPGDKLVSVNNKPITDVFDYRFLIQDENLLLEILKPDGQVWELVVEKDEDEDIGLGFETALMDKPRRCKNKCVFCFIDQLPPNMRGTLYFKDDDPRLSFLTGNYTTLTNLTRSDIQRIAYYHLSPLRISVHAANPQIRALMTGNPHAGELTEILRVFKRAGITMHFQIVLCNGINDGETLDETLRELWKLRPNAASVSVVPAGLTRYREGLYPLKPFSREEAESVVAQVERWQRHCRKRSGSAFVFAADEFYLQAGKPMPPFKRYEDFPQLENGVGMTALFEREFLTAMKKDGAVSGAETREKNVKFKRTGLVTGTAAGDFMRRLAALFTERHSGSEIFVYEIENTFFGTGVNVSGLLTGRDVIAQIRGKTAEDGAEVLFLPENAFRQEGKKNAARVMLDDVTLEDLGQALGVAVKVGSAHGGAFYNQLLEGVFSAVVI
ncbi:MAG: DUF512 domain-containing protein [Clostridiales bacterium]|jgi:putative radical SAM enzyme (TIGR03279 family)|nr:DUF512 domain-containing protein [Clostridiales bacterium]